MEQEQPTYTPQQQHKLVNASNAYPPEGKEEQEIQLLHKLRYLAYESDVNGTSQEFIASLHTRWKNLRVSKLTYSKLNAEESAQAYLSVLIEAACQGYLFRIEKQALTIPTLGDQLIWYESSLAVLICLYRNIDHFDPASVVKVFNAIAERSKDFPDEMSALFARFQPEFDQFKDCYRQDEVSKVQLRGYLTAVSHGIIDWLPGGFEKVGLHVEMTKNGFDQFEVPIKPTITTTVAEEWQQFAPTTSTLLGQEVPEAIESSCEPDSSPFASKLQTNILGSKTSNNDDINITEPGDEIELIDNEATIDKDLIEDFIDAIYEGLFEFDPIIDEQIENERRGVLRVVRKACEKVADLAPEELMDPTEHMVRAAGRIVRYLRKHIPDLKDDSYFRSQIESSVYSSIDYIFDLMIVYTVEREGPLALFTHDDPPCAALKQALTNFVDKPHYIKTRSRPLQVMGEGNLTLLDDIGGQTIMKAYFSPNSFTEAEKRQTSATISHSCLLRAGYTLEHESITYGSMRYVKPSTGGTFWVFRTRNNHLCIPYQMLPIVSPLMDTVCGLRESLIGDYIFHNVMSFENYADELWASDDNDLWGSDDNDLWGIDDIDESLNESGNSSDILESDDDGFEEESFDDDESEEESSDDEDSEDEAGVSEGFFNKVKGLFAF